MTAKLLLRLASLLMLIHLIGHSIGMNAWKKDKNPAMQEVARWMMGPKFPFMGTMRSMGDYHDGYGYNASITMVIFIVLLWLASANAAGANPFVREATLTLAAALGAIAVVEFLYFFPFAAIITLLAALLTLSSWYMLRKA